MTPVESQRPPSCLARVGFGYWTAIGLEHLLIAEAKVKVNGTEEFRTGELEGDVGEARRSVSRFTKARPCLVLSPDSALHPGQAFKSGRCRQRRANDGMSSGA